MIKVKLGKGKGHRVEAGHPWIYANELETIEGTPQPGEIVEVYNFKNGFIGKGYFNQKSQIIIRLLTRSKEEEVNRHFFFNKLRQALKLRQQLGFKHNFRLVYGEADGLPGLIVDKLGPYLVIQSLALGIEVWKKDIVEALEKIMEPAGIYERNDVPVRVLEGLQEMKGFLTAPFPTQLIITEPDEIKFHVDIENGQKTGFFLDQKQNRYLIKKYVADARVLDCFCFSGSFSLYAGRYGAKSVLGLDISAQAIADAKKNAELNGLEKVITFEERNAFDALTDFYKERREFDTIILDPPAFTKSRSNIPNALKGYKEINLKAMKLLKSGGFLVTCTCSHFISPELFTQMLHEAASDAGKLIRQMEFSIQSKDHPYIWQIEETLYLKFFVLQVFNK